MNRYSHLIAALLVIAIGSNAPVAAAAPQVQVQSKINRTLTGQSAYNGCMVRVESVIVALDPSLDTCSSSWLSLDCEAIHHSQAAANAMWSSALVAFSLNKTVVFYVDEDIKSPSGHCVAQRIDVLY